MLSVIIPSHNDIYLYRTIDSIMKSFRGEYEIIPVIDGYTPKNIFLDASIKPVYLDKNVGMREAINIGVRSSHGEYIMRTDEHCMFGDGFDKIILDTIQPNWIVTARRHFLNPVKWEVMGTFPPVDCEKLVIQDGIKFAGQTWKSRSQELKDVPIIESMAMQGSCWVMPRKWWDEVIGSLQTEGYGPLYQDSHEMLFRTWKAGGKLMVNKNTWFAHKHRSFPRTHNYGRIEAMPGWKYSLDTWMDYYINEIKPRWNI